MSRSQMNYSEFIKTVNSSSSSTTTPWEGDYSYGKNRERFVSVFKGNAQRPLAHLKEKEAEIKDQKEHPVGMPKEVILFDPNELVVGGKNK